MKAGIICDLQYSRHILFKNYFYAIRSLYEEVQLVNLSEDLEGIEILFIGDDHYYIHKMILTQPRFIEKCNSDNIKVVIFTTEKIFNSAFAWNEDNYKILQGIKNLQHFTSDVDDCIKLGTVLNRMLISKHFKQLYTQKKDKVAFIGSTGCDSYKERREIIKSLKILIPIDIISPTIDSWEKYITTLSQYRFVLSPAGNNNAFTLRFYEILLAGSIPIQQVKDNTLKYYDIEAGFDDCIYFQDVNEVPGKIDNCTMKYSHNQIWLEDYLKNILND